MEPLITLDDPEDHAHDMADDDFVEDGESLTEFTEDGAVWNGIFGDGAYIPDHWWEVN